jgi:hypothetical protein
MSKNKPKIVKETTLCKPIAQKSTKRPLFLFSAQGKTREQLAHDLLMTIKRCS